MAKTRRTGRSDTFAARAASRFDSLRDSLRGLAPRVPLVASAATLVAIAGLAWWGLPRLRERADLAPPPAAGEALAVRFTSAPEWFDGLRQAEVAAEVARAVGEGSMLDATRLARAHAALQASGWFHSIEQVTLDDGGGFLVEATFVRPFAVVRHAGFDFLVDTGGRVLPMQWTAGHRPASPHYVAIVGASRPVVGAYGTPWPGADVAAGLELARALADRPWNELVAAVDVSTYESSESLALITQDGGRVVWGQAPGTRTVAELPVETKLGLLDYLHATHRRIDGGGGRILDLRSDLVTLQAEAARLATAGHVDGAGPGGG
ncbi:MAG: hypothetical protein RIS86_54 [Planctomycetota bacterium]|jgi:hypothetical protein